MREFASTARLRLAMDRLGLRDASRLTRRAAKATPSHHGLRGRGNPSRPRVFEAPVATATHPQSEVDDFMAGLRDVSLLLSGERFDFAVVQKWQKFPSQCSAAEREELRAIGDWLKAIGMHDAPKRLMRGAGVRGWSEGWKSLPDEEVVKYALGFRSWSRGDSWHDIFCQTEECAIYTWRDPPDDLIVLDGNALRDWMLGARPELCRALDEAHGVVGLDGGEYIMDAPDLLVVNRRRGVRKDKLHLSDDRKFFSVTVAEG